jgi:putative flippase GtrA
MAEKENEKKANTQGNPAVDLTGIATVYDDLDAKASLEKAKALRQKLAQADPQSPEAKALKKELTLAVKVGTARASVIGALLYTRAHQERSLALKGLRKALKVAEPQKKIALQGEIAKLKKETVEAERAIELDKVNAIHAMKGLPPVEVSGTAWKYRYGGWKAARPFVNLWNAFARRFPRLSQFIAFLMVSNGVTVIQILLQDLLLLVLNQAGLASITFQLWAIPGASCVNIYGSSIYYTQYYIFDYFKGTLDSTVVRDTFTMAGGGGLAYFLSVQLSGALAQVLNFFAQRKVTFKSHSNPFWAALWYILAYFAIMVISSAVQGLYKAPIYQFFVSRNLGTFLPNLITMIIYCAISFWVFFPIFKFIFPSDKTLAQKAAKKAARKQK